MRRIITFTFLALAIPLMALADEEAWILASKSESGYIYEFKKDSLSLEANKDGEAVVTVAARWRSSEPRESEKIELYQMYVTKSDCEFERGKVVYLDTNNNFVNQYDFVFDEGTVASELAEIICKAADKALADFRKDNIDLGSLSSPK